MSLRSLNEVTVPTPCEAAWDKMIGNDRVRFCEHCSLHVNDLSSLTRQEALRLVASSQGRLCVRFVQKPNGAVLTRTMPEKLYRIRRRVSRMAAGAFTATISVASAMAQTSPNSTPEQLNQRVVLVETESEPELIIDKFTATVTGTIREEPEEDEQEGPGISDATVVLVDRETGEERTATSILGQYSFQFLPQGQYLLWARKSGLRTALESVTVPPNATVNVDIQMYDRMVGFGMGGAMAMVMQSEDPLFTAISDNDVQKVRTLVSSDLDLNVADRRDGRSLLTQAVERGNREIVATLLVFGADVNLRNSSGRSPLMSLTGTATSELVRDLLAAGARLNARDNNGSSPLMIAAGIAPARVLKDLVEAGANVNARDSSGETCLFFAARSNTPEAIIQLLAAGVDMNIRNDDGENALMATASGGTFENFRVLLERGSDRNLVDNDRRTLLMLAVTNEDPRVAKLLVELGADPNAKDSRRNTALMTASEGGLVQAVRLLVSAGAELDARDEDGDTALMKATRRDDLECFKLLLNAGADITKKDKEGKTVLAQAREYKSAEVVKLLEARGAPD